jgi:putative membrane protein
MRRPLARAIRAAWVLTMAVAAPATASSPDAIFVTKAADAGAQTIEVAKVGAAKAASTGVKAFAQRLAVDHRVLTGDLLSLARSKDVRVPAPSATPAAADIAPRSGAAFDRAFLAQVVKAHDALIALFESESRDGRDADVKEWAAKQLPALRDHLAKARALAARYS